MHNILPDGSGVIYILVAMIKSHVTICLIFLAASLAAAQQNEDRPKRVTIARHTFIDVGPPNDFYEVIQLNEEGDRTHVQRALITPGESCLQPTTVDARETTVEKPLHQILLEKNPCDIPENVLKKERNRCKHCVTFSGQNITLHLTCNGHEKSIRADILDADIFSKTPNTPTQTSWTMKVLAQLDGALGPGVWDKPMFSVVDTETSASTTPKLDILDTLRDGAFDTYFNSDKKMSELYQESLKPVQRPSVELVRAIPLEPITTKIPNYPPIARAAQVEGNVELSFDISPAGMPQSVSTYKGAEMFRGVATDAITNWTFPASSEIEHEKVIIGFRLNCKEPVP